MSIDWWSEPVRVAVSGGTAVNVSSNGEAAKMLLEEWPEEAGEKHLRARQTILRSMNRPDDPGTLYAARMAFEAAAREAGILLGERPKSIAPKGFKAPRWRGRRR